MISLNVNSPRRLFILLLCVLASSPAHAAQIEVSIDLKSDDASGDWVLSLHSASDTAVSPPVEARMDQRERRLEPDLLVVSVGSTVRFPNSDNIRHHVYSFSDTKRFELPLYSGTQAEPVQFPVPGVVALGCNIHDWMQAHILVLDTPYYVQAPLTAESPIRLQAPAGDYVLRVWHSRLQFESPWIEREVTLSEQGVLSVTVLAELRPAQPPAISEDARIRALQERFRALRKDR